MSGLREAWSDADYDTNQWPPFKDGYYRGYDDALDDIDMHRWYVVLPDGRVIGVQSNDGLGLYADYAEYVEANS